GVANSILLNCTVTGNSAGGGGGAFGGEVRNSILYFNTAPLAANWMSVGMSPFDYSCTTPTAPGTANISADPQLLNDGHIAVTSPCRGAGSFVYTSGTDIDGEAWTNPPSMGCDEVWEQ